MTHDLVLAALDFETTGVDPLTARPVEASLLLSAPDGSVTCDHYWLINPGVEIPAEAAAVHGITTERAASGVPAKEAVALISATLASRAFRDVPLVICNVPYDWPLLLAELARHELTAPPEPLFLDPLLLDRVIDKYRKGSRKLTDMAMHYAISFDGRAHGAKADALAAVAVVRKILASGSPLIGDATVEDLQQLQRAWFAEWKAGINAYWKRKGENKEVTNDWPA